RTSIAWTSTICARGSTRTACRKSSRGCGSTARCGIWACGRRRRNSPRGSPSNPMRDQDIEDKLRAIAAGWHTAHELEPLIDAVWTLDKSSDVADLLALTVPRA